MRRLIVLCMALCAMGCFTACALFVGIPAGVLKLAGSIDPQRMVKGFDGLVGMLGGRQLTADSELIGRRVFGEDGYTGEYEAQCVGVTAKEVVFGGASVYGRRVYVLCDVERGSGDAALRVRIGADAEEYTPDEDGRICLELNLEGGGDYIMLRYDDFTGSVRLSVAYANDE